MNEAIIYLVVGYLCVCIYIYIYIYIYKRPPGFGVSQFN